MRSIGLPELIFLFGILLILVLVPLALIGLVISWVTKQNRHACASRSCGHCGQRIPDIGNFCPICGQKSPAS